MKSLVSNSLRSRSGRVSFAVFVLLALTCNFAKGASANVTNALSKIGAMSAEERAKVKEAIAKRLINERMYGQGNIVDQAREANLRNKDKPKEQGKSLEERLAELTGQAKKKPAAAPAAAATPAAAAATPVAAAVTPVAAAVTPVAAAATPVAAAATPATGMR